MSESDAVESGRREDDAAAESRSGGVEGAGATAGGGQPETRPGGPQRRALVTGGAVRLGRAVVEALAGSGYRVGVHYHASRSEATELVQRLRARGEPAEAFGADLRRPEEIEALFRAVEGELGGLDLLVNSAAVFPRTPPDRATAEEWDEVFTLNARAPFLCTREAAAIMGKEGGAVVNVADVAAFEAWPSYAPYAASKAALVSLTRSLSLAWAPRIRVNAVAPGPVLLPDDADEEERARARESTALGRIGEPGDVADAVLYLAGASFVTGEVIRVDGGEHVARRGGR